MQWRVVLVALALLGGLDASSAGAQEPVPLTFVGATDDGYKLTRPSRDFVDRFRIVRTDAGRGDLRVEISAPDLLAPHANPTPLTIALGDQVITGPVTIPRGGAILTVRATLVVPDTYTSQIRVTAPKTKPLVIPLQIIRSRVATTVEFKDLDAVPGVTGDEVAATFSIRETSGQKTTFYPPDLSGLALIVANKRLQATIPEPPTVSRINGNGTKEPLTPGQPLDIEPGAVQKFTIAVKGLERAGEYGGTLHVTSPDGSTIDQPVTLLLRDSEWLAGMLIVLGVALSMGLRWYYQTKRPEIVRSRSALDVLKQLDVIGTRRDLTEDAAAVVRSLQEQLRRAYDQVQIGDAEAADATITDVKNKIELLAQWADASKIVGALGSSSIAPPIRKKLEAARLVLVGPGAATGDIPAALKTVREIPGDIRAALAADFTAARTALEAALAKRPGGAGHSPITQQAIAEVNRLVDDAKRAFSGDNLVDARELISRARKQFVIALADEMQTSMAAVPLGFEPTKWTPVADEIARLLAVAKDDADQDRAWRAYNEARRRYLLNVLRGLSREHAEVAAILSAVKQKSPNNPKLTENSDRMDAVKADLASAQTLVDTDLDAAFDRARQSDEDIRAVSTSLAGQGVMMGAAGQPAAAFFRAEAAPRLGSVDSADALAELSASPAALLQNVRQSLRLWDFGVTVIIAVIAVLLGMKTLWFGSYTWGGPADMATAVLWGLGLHQVSFDGVNNLAQKFSK